MKFLKSILASAVLLGAAATCAAQGHSSHMHAFAHHSAHEGHGHGRGWGRGYGGFYVGWWPWYYSAWYDPWYYDYPMGYPYSIYAEPAAPVSYVEMNPSAPAAGAPSAAEAPGVWYYCQNPEGYYPYVKSCPAGWQKVPAQPPR